MRRGGASDIWPLSLAMADALYGDTWPLAQRTLRVGGVGGQRVPSERTWLRRHASRRPTRATSHMTWDIMLAIGEQLRDQRRACGCISQADLARLARIHPVHVSRIERGTQRDVGIITLHKLCGHLDMLPSELLRRIGL